MKNKSSVKSVRILDTAAIALCTLIFGIGQDSLVQSALAADTPVIEVGACGLPVCDLQGELSLYSSMTQAQRYARLSLFRSSFKKTTDVALLKNLAELGNGLAELFRSLGEEDWMVREANALASDALIGLSKHDALDAKVLAGYYGRISGEAVRYSVITYWKERVSQYEKSEPLLELLDYFSRIGKISAVEGDPDYLAREARNAEELISSRLMELSPYFEGVYGISVSCSGGVSVPAYCRPGYMDRLVVMETQGAERLEVSLLNSKTGTILYSFTGVTLSNGGTTFEAVGSPGGALSQLRLTLDRRTGKVAGWIRNSDLSEPVQLAGRLLGSPASVFEKQAAAPNAMPLSSEMLSRSYRGKFGGYDAGFTIRVFEDNRFGATLSISDLPQFKIRFQSVKFYPKSGIVVLVGTQSNGSRMKMTLFYKVRDDLSIEISGTAFSGLNGGIYEVSMVASAQ